MYLETPSDSYHIRNLQKGKLIVSVPETGPDSA
jgi:hypothetical protein